ncbi:hypothetical protein BD626DRAFT_503079, partial [Schizophyllum amplum]
MSRINGVPYLSRRSTTSHCKPRHPLVALRYRLPQADRPSLPLNSPCLANKGDFVMWRRF